MCGLPWLLWWAHCHSPLLVSAVTVTDPRAALAKGGEPPAGGAEPRELPRRSMTRRRPDRAPGTAVHRHPDAHRVRSGVALVPRAVPPALQRHGFFPRFIARRLLMSASATSWRARSIVTFAYAPTCSSDITSSSPTSAATRNEQVAAISSTSTPGKLSLTLWVTGSTSSLRWWRQLTHGHGPGAQSPNVFGRRRYTPARASAATERRISSRSNAVRGFVPIDRGRAPSSIRRGTNAFRAGDRRGAGLARGSSGSCSGVCRAVLHTAVRAWCLCKGCTTITSGKKPKHRCPGGGGAGVCRTSARTAGVPRGGNPPPPGGRGQRPPPPGPP